MQLDMPCALCSQLYSVVGSAHPRGSSACCSAFGSDAAALGMAQA